MVRQTLRKPERIRKRSDFDRLFRDCQVTRGAMFRAHHRFRKEEDSPIPVRAAFVAGKRIGKAVTRNRIKRLLREAFRRIKKDLKPPAPIDLVFVANRDFSDAKSDEVVIEMRGILERIGILPAAASDGGSSAS